MNYRTHMDMTEQVEAIERRNALIYLGIASLAVWGMYELAEVPWGWL